MMEKFYTLIYYAEKIYTMLWEKEALYLYKKKHVADTKLQELLFVEG